MGIISAYLLKHDIYYTIYLYTSVPSLENVTPLVSRSPHPASRLHTTPPNNSRPTSSFTPTRATGKNSRDSVSTPTGRFGVLAQGEKSGESEQEEKEVREEKEVLKEKEVKEERQHYGDNRGRSPSPGRSRRVPLVVSFVSAHTYMCGFFF